jgi:hypothetical protein
MDITAERKFGLVRGATSAHIQRDLRGRSDNKAGQRSLSPKGSAENGPATMLFLSRRSMKDILLRHASSAGCFGRNSNIQSFLTGCLAALRNGLLRNFLTGARISESEFARSRVGIKPGQMTPHSPLSRGQFSVVFSTAFQLFSF